MKDFSPTQIANLAAKAERKFRAIAAGSTGAVPFRYMTAQEQADCMRRTGEKPAKPKKASVVPQEAPNKLHRAIASVQAKTQQKAS